LPTYAYRCESCGNQYEKREGFSAPARQKCPNCGKQAQRVLFAPPIVFKGSGFYVTDSRKAPASSDGSVAGSAEGGRSTAASKPDTKGTDSGSPGSSPVGGTRPPPSD
jgi:putative FmdB family regulatory protein